MPAEVFLDLEKISSPEVSEKMRRIRVTGEKILLIKVNAKRGALIPRHIHQVEQLTVVLSGVLKMVLNGKEFILKRNNVLITPAKVFHEGEVLEDSEYFDFFPEHVQLFKI